LRIVTHSTFLGALALSALTSDASANQKSEPNLAADESALTASKLSAAQEKLAGAYWALRMACAAAETARSNDELWKMPPICGRVDAAYLEMNKGGVCYGKDDQPIHEYGMHICRPGSIGYEDSESLPGTALSTFMRCPFWVESGH
jgi:hypothetical protein